jgi:hypothetical protein
VFSSLLQCQGDVINISKRHLRTNSIVFYHPIFFFDIFFNFWYFSTTPCFSENKPCTSFCMVTWTTFTNPLERKIWKHVFSDTSWTECYVSPSYRECLYTTTYNYQYDTRWVTWVDVMYHRPTESPCYCPPGRSSSFRIRRDFVSGKLILSVRYLSSDARLPVAHEVSGMGDVLSTTTQPRLPDISPPDFLSSWRMCRDFVKCICNFPKFSFQLLYNRIRPVVVKILSPLLSSLVLSCHPEDSGFWYFFVFSTDL